MRLISWGLFILFLVAFIGLLKGGGEGPLIEVGEWLVGAGVVVTLLWAVAGLFDRGSPRGPAPFSY